jgi:hypothetical protein
MTWTTAVVDARRGWRGASPRGRRTALAAPVLVALWFAVLAVPPIPLWFVEPYVAAALVPAYGAAARVLRPYRDPRPHVAVIARHWLAAAGAVGVTALPVALAASSLRDSPLDSWTGFIALLGLLAGVTSLLWLAVELLARGARGLLDARRRSGPVHS